MSNLTAGDRKIDMRTWFNPRHISALDLATEQGSVYTETTVTIDRIVPPQEVQCGPKKEMLAQAVFKGKKKKMLLRESHMKSLIRLFGYNIQKMSGKRVTLWVETGVKAFGKEGDFIRIRAAQGTGRSLMPSLQAPMDRIEPETAAIVASPKSQTVEGLQRQYEEPLTPEAEAALAEQFKDEQPTGQQEITP